MNNNLIDYELACKLKYMVNKGQGVDIISTKLGLSEDVVTRFLFNSGYVTDGSAVKKKKDYDIYIKKKKIAKNFINILVLADTHLGHKYERIDLLKHIYNEAYKKETDLIFHLGDLSNGINKDSIANSFESLKNHCIRHYPYSEIETYILSGNHDYFKKNNRNIVEEVTNVRKDLYYLGDRPMILNVNDCKFLLAHGDDKKKNYHRLMKSTNANVLMYGHEHHYGLLYDNEYNELKVPSLLDDGIKDMGVWWLTLYDNKQIDYELETFPKRVLKK